jgi:hypothetical protein
VTRGSKRERCDPPRLSRLAHRRANPVLEHLVVKIVTDEGITGYGESTPDIGFFGETLEEVRTSMGGHLGHQLLGVDPFDRKAIRYQLDFRGNSCARPGIDLALHDLLGKAVKVPKGPGFGVAFDEEKAQRFLSTIVYRALVGPRESPRGLADQRFPGRARLRRSLSPCGELAVQRRQVHAIPTALDDVDVSIDLLG